jgi:heme a synthase
MTTTPVPFNDLPAHHRRVMGWWMALWAVMIMLIVVIGGITRLTESGLSITEWAPVSGVLPPLSEAAWRDAFHAYQQIPEYQQLNQGMSLAEFKSIYFWEYVHRVWARLVGLMIAGPLVFFWLRGWLTRPLAKRLVTLLLLTGAQGALGWFMVASGLADRTDVSQYRLAAHLALALVIYVMTVWTAADLLWRNDQENGRGGNDAAGLVRAAGALVALVFATAIAGAFVAGLDGGKAYNTFPLMGGRLVPGGYATLAPWWRNLFENVAAVQFNHRWFGILTLASIVVVWYRGRKGSAPSVARKWLHLLPLIALLQVSLGVATLLLVVPIWLAALHQTGAVILLTTSVLLFHSLVRGGRTRREVQARAAAAGMPAATGLS